MHTNLYFLLQLKPPQPTRQNVSLHVYVFAYKVIPDPLCYIPPSHLVSHFLELQLPVIPPRSQSHMQWISLPQVNDHFRTTSQKVCILDELLWHDFSIPCLPGTIRMVRQVSMGQHFSTTLSD